MIDKTKFDPKGFYAAMAESKSLLVGRDAVGWLEQYEAPGRPVDALIAFGCAVQHTPHLMLETVEVFRTLGVDFAAVAGRQFCCGRPFQRIAGEQEVADRVSAKSYERFKGFGSNVVVQFCGACMLQYLEVINARQDPPFDVIHVTKYLADLLRERGDAVPWKSDVPRRVLLHTHSDSLPQQDTDTASIIEILNMIPGVEYAGMVRPPSAGAPCKLYGPTAVGILTTVDTEGYRAARAELAGQLAAAEADTLVTPYHRCQMEWSKLSGRELPVREWMSLLAEALGVGQPDRYTMYWHLGDPAKIVERSRPEWSSWGISEEEALDMARRHFVPEFAVDVHECDCGGTGCGSPGTWIKAGALRQG